MKSVVAVLTYNRVKALTETLSGLSKFCPGYITAVFEDCGQRDGSDVFLKGPNPVKIGDRPDLLAEVYKGDHLGPRTTVYLGTTNLGVTGNSNRAIKWFEQTGADHLCLLNDDLHVLGDFVNFYANGHTDLGVGLWCFCDFKGESYRWVTVNSRGHRIKLLPRMTGIMMSLTRAVVEKVGYYDSRFGRMGQEHCDYTIRARNAGFIDLDGRVYHCLDLDASPPVLIHQEVPSSISGAERAALNKEADSVISALSKTYGIEPVYQPFRLRQMGAAAGHAGLGIPMENLKHLPIIDAPA